MDPRCPMLVVTLPAARAGDPAAFVREARDRGARLIEIRCDLTPGVMPFDADLPLLFSPRGGPLQSGLREGVDALDLDPALDGEHARETVDASFLVRSFHDHKGTPDEQELLRTGRELRRRGAALVKLAVTPGSYEQLGVLDRVREQLAKDGPVTVHAMGPLAELERARSPWRNAWTYARFDASAESAPGQLDLAHYQALTGPAEPAVFGVAGSTEAVQRSGGPALHSRLLREQGVCATYLRFPVCDPEVDFRALAELGVRGLSVTTPAKLAAYRFAASHDENARAAESANTLLFGAPSRALQLDSQGLVRGYPQLAGLGPVSVVGTGGVVPSVLLAGRELGWRDITLFGRDAARAEALTQRFGTPFKPLEKLGEHTAQLIVWCLPLDRPDLDLPEGKGSALDLRYGAATEFLERAAAAGRIPYDGQAMFEAQARAQSAAFLAALGAS